MKAKLLAASILAAGLAGAAGAQDFAVVDANGDGFVTLDEVNAVDSAVTADGFAAFDTDGDARLSEDEFTVWAETDAEVDTEVDMDIETEPMDVESEIEVETDTGITFDDGSDDEPEADASDPQ